MKLVGLLLLAALGLSPQAAGASTGHHQAAPAMQALAAVQASAAAAFAALDRCGGSGSRPQLRCHLSCTPDIASAASGAAPHAAAPCPVERPALPARRSDRSSAPVVVAIAGPPRFLLFHNLRI